MISSETGTTQLATAKLVEQVYYKVEREALDRGVPKSLIPSIGNMRSTLYRIRKKYDLLQVSNMDDIDDGIMHGMLYDQVFSDRHKINVIFYLRITSFR